VLESVYRQTLCSNCREQAVKLMRDKQALPDVMVQERLWDANDAIRDGAVEIMATGTAWTNPVCSTQPGRSSRS